MSFKPVKALFGFGTQFKDILDENHEAGDCRIDCQTLSKPRKYERHRQNSPSAISGSTVILWCDEDTFCMQRKQK